MYIKKLFKTNITIKSLFGLFFAIIGIIALFSFFSFRDARDELDNLIKTWDGNIPSMEMGSIGIFTPTFFMVAAGALGFGFAYFAQIYTLSLQMNISRKNLYRTNIISQLVCAAVLTGAYIAGNIGINYLFSLLNRGKYEPLAEKYREQAFNFSIVGESSGNVFHKAALMFGICLGAAVLGAVLIMVFSRFKGAKLAFIIAVPAIVFIGVLVVCAYFKLKAVGICFAAAVLALELFAQWKMTKTQSMEFSMTKTM